MDHYSARSALTSETRRRSAVVTPVAFTTVALLLLAVPAFASGQTQGTDIRIQGRIQVLEGIRLPDNTSVTVPTPDIVRLVTADGVAVDLAGNIPANILPGTVFDGVVSIPVVAVKKVQENLHARASKVNLDTLRGAVLDGRTDSAKDVVAASSASHTPLLVKSADYRQPTPTPTASSTVSAAGRAAVAVAHTLNVVVVNLPAAPAEVVATDGQVASLGSTLSDFWTSQSGGQIAGLTIAGSIHRLTSENACSPADVWLEAAAKFDRSAYSYTGQSAAHLVVIAPQSCANSFVGMATVGSKFDGGLVWLSYFPNIVTITGAHELGHNLSMRHANVSICSDGVPEGANCGDLEYYDFYNVMGAALTVNGKGNPRLPALNINQQDQLGMNSPAQLIPVALADGAKPSTMNYTIAAISDTSGGARGLKITDPETKNRYYVEYRNGTGMDANALYTTGFSASYASGVRVLSLRPDQSSAVLTSMAPNKTDHPLYLTAGQTLTLGDGVLSVAVVSTGATATVKVALGQQAIVPGNPTLAGNAVVGSTLTADPGTWSAAPDSFSYQWAANGTVISGATQNRFALTAAQLGATVTVTVTGHFSGRPETSATSAPSASITPGTLTQSPGAPWITGTIAFGQTVTVNSPGWGPAPVDLRYQWYRNGSAIAGATSQSYVISSADLSTQLAASVTGAKPGYTTVMLTSVGRGVNSAQTLTGGGLRVTKTLSRGKASYAAFTSWGPNPVTVGYQWMLNGRPISGATQANYVGLARTLGAVSVTVTASKVGYTTAVRSSGVTPIPKRR